MAERGSQHGSSLRIYAFLIRGLPADFRVLFGPQMIQAFRDLLRAGTSRSGFLDLARLWSRTLVDLAVTAAILHFERLTMPAVREPRHFDLLIHPWAFLIRINATRRWLARFKPYPKPFRKPLEYAWYEARAYSSPKIQAEHILLGLLRAVKLVRQHVTPTAIQTTVAVIDRHTGHRRCLISSAPSEPVVDPISQQAIARAMELAALRRQRLSALHLLFALCEERGGAVAECLSSLGLDQRWLESQLEAA